MKIKKKLFEQDLSKYLVSKFVLKYNIKPWGVFHPVCYWGCYCGLYLMYLEIDVFAKEMFYFDQSFNHSIRFTCLRISNVPRISQHKIEDPGRICSILPEVSRSVHSSALRPLHGCDRVRTRNIRRCNGYQGRRPREQIGLLPIL